MFVPHPSKGTLVLIDTEGQDLGKTSLHAMLYNIVLLMSSNFCFFADGVLDNYTLGKGASLRNSHSRACLSE